MKSKELKYVVVALNVDREAALLFDPRIVHADVYDKSKIKSAGFCRLTFDDRSTGGLIIDVYGRSDSLKIESRPLLDKNLIYQSLMVGPWDYFLNPDEPLYDVIDKVINSSSEVRTN